MSGVREPAVAGRFYPANTDALRAAVQSYLRTDRTATAVPKGIIAPHAGYVYSGPIAGTAHAVLRGLRDRIERVILFGPSHFVRVNGLAVPSSDTFATPLGRVPIDTEAVQQALRLRQVTVNDAAHAREHSLEVHVPFLQEVLGTFKLVPFAVGETTPGQVAEVMELLWGGPETFFVVSSDLSHFHDHETAARIDAETSHLIESLRFEALSSEQCCGFKAIGGLLQAARARGMHARTLDLRNSGDTAGPRDRVVGYGAYVVE
ncbi:MAG TPA: AmmeMemoRadiSam system protein B [Planctomycetaceae bacterium]|jgi:AmmeMemoRadiSam system protein B|nr:AmmeMemoRadiSam system protein B [Planctomycetaceae bacterium]